MAIAKEAQYWIDYLPQEGGGGGENPYDGLYGVASPDRGIVFRLQAFFTC